MRRYLHLQLTLFSLVCLVSRQPAAGQSSGFDDFTAAIRANNLPALQQLAHASAGGINQKDKTNSTPLHRACMLGSDAAVRLLVEAGADIKATDNAGATPLLYAAWSLDRTRLLVARGANVNAAQNDGVTPLMVAAAAYGNVATVRYLLEMGAQVNALDKLRNDALMRSDDPAIVAVLLARGADARRANVAGSSALHNPLAFRDYERTRLLLAAGAEPNQLNTFAGVVAKGPIAMSHQSTLMVAAPHSEERTVKALLTAGARVNEVDVRKMSPLMLAIATDHAKPSVVRALIDAGADVNAKDLVGDSVYAWALKFRNPQILAELRRSGAQQPAPASAPPQPELGAQAPNAQAALNRALPLLSSSAKEFFHQSGCLGCHHQLAQARLSTALTRSRISPDPAFRTNFRNSLSTVTPLAFATIPVLTKFPGGDYNTLLDLISGYAALGEPPAPFTDAILHYLAAQQRPSGCWVNLGVARPPIEDSTITLTSEAIRAFAQYRWPARQSEFSLRLRQARECLQKTEVATTYEQADKISGLHAAGASPADLAREAGALLQLQRSDGGWAQTPYLESDAYATGLALHSLHDAGLLLPADPAYRRGVAFLLRTQFKDGSWYVRSRAPKFQPYFQSGFPFEHDQWISIAATSLAAMALAPATTGELPSLPPPAQPTKTAMLQQP